MREDALALYGFATEREKALFERLIAVSGIGPRLAQVVLSGMAPDDLHRGARRGDVARLTAHPRRRQEDRRADGRRAARQARRRSPRELPAATRRAARGGSDEDLVAALVNLGYKPAPGRGAPSARRARRRPQAAFHELLRLALRRLARV